MLKVAITEDDYRVASIHEGFLEQVGGCEVVFKALNAEDTLDQLKKIEVDLMLLDIYMPDRLGTEIIEEIKAIKPDIGIIMISAGTDKQIVQEALKRGVFDYIIKPVTIDRFKDTVNKYKQFHEKMSEKEEVDQALLDTYFGRSLPSEQIEDTPKGIDPLTLKKVKGILQEASSGITADQMGQQMGASRTTARRYLEHLISEGECLAELEYGIVGRPERKYYKS
ncbi:response regulator [Tenuibacillus multivorans]|uniref:Two-component system, CitB family, response regulator CitT n=1 Tax=Tenuibacillus multivorans TaxID=237069 RepID=A0A1G9WND1_9BACI|nr:response regulator [Tenuibacillus multivorans]GEL78006.1 transcriptional regulator [Tenuibacillus multivorans]SDM85723.1 two-component system, CitB family, response regulator CitT [Tenuibacillus multivorans]